MRDTSPIDAFLSAYDAEPSEIRIGGRRYRLFAPRSIERYLQEAGAFNGFPLWARIWPASLVLAEALASTPPDPRREWLEIGGGLGQVSIVAASCGHRITFSEANPHALAFARASAALNGLPHLPIVRLDWGGEPPPGAFDVLVGSELVFREADIAPLRRLFTRLLKPGGEILLSGEVRRTTDAFLRHMAEFFHIRIHRKRLTSGPQDLIVLLFRLQPK